MDIVDPVEINPNKLGGEPVFAGTRIPVAILFDYLESGASVDAFLDDFDIDRALVHVFLHDLRERTAATA
ncbi:MAG: DUF433 domain-containing protein [Bacteroidota bacterium]